LPRTEYTEKDKLWAGWKGMTWHFRDTIPHLKENSPPYEEQHLMWIHPWIGRRFYKLFQEYQNKYYWTNPHTETESFFHTLHPWLLINITSQDYGEPFRRPQIYKSWERALKNIKMKGCGLGPHSLRHMYGGLCVQLDDENLTKAQGMLHHASIESTKIYCKPDEETVRNIIYEKTMQQAPLKKKALDFNLPKTWSVL
jgi:integrase